MKKINSNKLREKLKRKRIESEDYKIAFDFATKVYKKFREVIKSIVLFGSVAKNTALAKSDIDIVILIDDSTIDWDQELIAWYREELAKLVAAQKYKKRLHINTVTLTTFWEELKAGEPVAINILRYGETLIDFGGFFDPLKVLLAKGKIRPTPEAVYTTLRRSPQHISRAYFNVLSAIESLYWSMVDSAHAALMAANQIPPSPEHIAEMLDLVFVNKGKLNKKYVNWYKEMYELAHRISHNNIQKIKGREVDVHIEKVEEFEKVMVKLTNDLIKHEKIVKVEKKK